MPIKLESLSPAEVLLHIKTTKDADVIVHNVIELLKFHDNLDLALTSQPGVLAYFEGLMSDVIREHDAFAEVFLMKWKAHSRRYARYYLLGRDRKETIESLNDAVILLFGADSMDERDAFLAPAYLGSLIDAHGEREGRDQEKSDKALGNYVVRRKQFADAMFAYVEQGWTFERVMEERLTLADELEKIRVVCRAIADRGYRIASYVSLHKSHLT